MLEAEYSALNRFADCCVRRYGRGLGGEDCRSEVWRAILEAKRYYPNVAGCCDFESFMDIYVHVELDELRKKRSRRLALESPFSLDTPYYDTNESTLAHLPGKCGDCSGYVALWDYAERLGNTKHRIARLLYRGLEDGEVMDICGMGAKDYYEVLEELQDDFRQWQMI